MKKIWWTWDLRMRWSHGFCSDEESFLQNYTRAIDDVAEAVEGHDRESRETLRRFLASRHERLRSSAVARGQNAASDRDVFKSNPQLAKLLVSDFKALVVGYRSDGNVRQYLPPSPASVYAFVYNSHADEVRQFTQSLNFLNLLLDSRLPMATDEVVAAFLRSASRTHPDPKQFLVRAGKELAWLLSNDIRRLDSILKRLSQ